MPVHGLGKERFTIVFSDNSSGVIMAAVFLAGQKVVRPLLTSCRCLAAPTLRSYAYWNKDWRPGPYPRTPEERAAAAKKYGLRVEDYEPYPDDGFGHGDYPKLPRVSVESRSDNGVYDIPTYKRNFGEPMHTDYDAMTADRWNPNIRRKFSYMQMLAWFTAVVGSLGVIYVLTLDKPHFSPVMPKQFPSDLKEGEKHYTFECVE